MAEIDLGLLAGNAYRPAALAITGETAYVLCQNVGAPDAETVGIACGRSSRRRDAGDLARCRVSRAAPLPPEAANFTPIIKAP
jgi:hypothetical protein